MDEPTAPAPRCAEHDGAHGTYLGRCYAFGKAAARPFVVSGRDWPCANCGQRVYARITTATGERTMLDVTSGDEHACPAPLRVEINEDRLAAAIVAASRVSREQIRHERQHHEPSVAYESSPEPPQRPPARPRAPVEPGAMATVAVWTDDGSTA